MRFTAVLLLTALAAALISAQISPAQNPINVQEPTASLQETVVAAQPARPNSPLKSIIDKGVSAAGKAFEGAEKKVSERIQDGKQFIESGASIIETLRKKVFPRDIGI